MLIWKWGQALISGYNNKPQKGYVEVQPDAGTPYRRQMFSDISDLITATFSLTRDKYIALKAWYRNELRQGTLPFLYHDCRYNRDRVARLVGDVPDFQPDSDRFNVTVNIAFEPLVIKEDRYLTVGDNTPLIVNNNDTLIVNYEIRV